MFATHCVTRELAPRGGFEPPTFRLTAKKPNSSQLAGAEAKRRESASSDKTDRIRFAFSFQFLSAIYHHLSQFA